MRKSKVTATQDNDGHWYVIPSHMSELFDELNEDESKEDDFCDKFDMYATGGCLNNIQLYAEIKE